jgi:hypothetical protein
MYTTAVVRYYILDILRNRNGPGCEDMQRRLHGPSLNICVKIQLLNLVLVPGYLGTSLESYRGFVRKGDRVHIKNTFPSLPDCWQNQTAVSHEQHLLSDF